jgi:hypothetical protein
MAQTAPGYASTGKSGVLVSNSEMMKILESIEAGTTDLSYGNYVTKSKSGELTLRLTGSLNGSKISATLTDPKKNNNDVCQLRWHIPKAVGPDSQSKRAAVAGLCAKYGLSVFRFLPNSYEPVDGQNPEFMSANILEGFGSAELFDIRSSGSEIDGIISEDNYYYSDEEDDYEIYDDEPLPVDLAEFDPTLFAFSASEADSLNANEDDPIIDENDDEHAGLKLVTEDYPLAVNKVLTKAEKRTIKQINIHNFKYFDIYAEKLVAVVKSGASDQVDKMRRISRLMTTDQLKYVVNRVHQLVNHAHNDTYRTSCLLEMPADSMNLVGEVIADCSICKQWGPLLPLEKIRNSLLDKERVSGNESVQNEGENQGQSSGGPVQ